MDTALAQNFSFILDRNLAKANCTENHVCTSCDKVVLDFYLIIFLFKWNRNFEEMSSRYERNFVEMKVLRNELEMSVAPMSR